MTETQQPAVLDAIDPIHQPTPMLIGKKTYLLNFDFDSLARAEAASGMSLLFGIDWSSIGVKRLEGILQAALAKHQPALAIGEIRSLIKPRNVGRIEAALIEAWFSAMPEIEETGDTGNPLQPQV